ncbi:MAG: Calx-beta domain-containing protein [Planctomycetaceae bacterium]
MLRHQGRQGISRFFSGLFGKSTNTLSLRRSAQRKARKVRARAGVEFLESRTLLTFVGVDFGGGTTPTNWTSFSGTTDATLTNLTDDTGTPSGFNLSINVDSSPGGNFSFTPAAGQLPVHATSLSGLDGNYGDQGTIELTFSNLVPNQSYQIYVFAGDDLAGDQRVTISDPVTTTVLQTFDQPHSANQLVINGEVGTSARALQSYAVSAAASSTGELLIRVDNSNNPTQFFGLAGVAIETASAPTELVLNEIISDTPGGTDIPNEYVELKGTPGQSLDNVYLAFVEGNSGGPLGEIRSGNGGLIDLTGSFVGSNGYLVIVDDAAAPYSIDTNSTIHSVPGLDIGDPSFTAVLLYVDPQNGTAPTAGFDLDSGDDGLDALPTGWQVLDSISVLDGAANSRAYGNTVFTPNGNGLSEPGANRIDIGATVHHVMRVGQNDPTEVPEVYEGFDYTPDGAQLVGRNGGSGFSGSWAAGGFNANLPNSDLYTTVLAPLDSPGLINSPGHAVAPAMTNGAGGLRRLLTSSIGQDNTTKYFSVVLEPQGTLGQGNQGGFFGIYLDSASLPDDLFVGSSGTGNYGIENRGGAGKVTSNVAPVSGESVLLVVKAEFLPGNDQFTLYVNPQLNAQEPLSGGVIKSDLDLGLVDALTIYSGGAYELDEVRIGSTFASVAPAGNWVGFELADPAPDYQIATSVAPNFQANAVITDHVGSVNPTFATPPPTLTVNIAATSISENGGTTTATVTRASDTTNPLTVTLVSSDTTEATVVGTVTIPAGQSVSAPFTITAVDDSLADGIQSVIITASAAGHVDGTDSVDILDDEAAQLVLSLSATEISEADGPAAATATVTRNTDPSQPLVVTIASSDTSEATVPTTITIPAGLFTSAPFALDAVDDLLVDGTQTVTISASAQLAGALGLDTAFGTNGLTDTGVSVLGPGLANEGVVAVVQPDNKIVLASTPSVSPTMQLVRLNPDGSRDTSFGTAGLTTVVPLVGTNSRVHAITLLPDGRILAAGGDSNNNGSAYLVQFNADGTVDSTFGTNGVATPAAGGVIKDIVLRPDGRILAATGINGTQYFRFAQFNADGSLDTTFGSAGTVADLSASRLLNEIDLLPDGTFIGAGLGGGRISMSHYSADGVQLSGFGTNGRVNYNTGLSNGPSARDLAIDPSGRILVSFAGDGGISDLDLMIARFLPDGSIDSTFGTAGLARVGTSGNNFGSGGRMILQADGRILIGGRANSDMVFARFDSNGQLDPTFNGTGIFRVDIGATYPGGESSDEMEELLLVNGLPAAVSGRFVFKLTDAVTFSTSETIDVTDDDLGSWIPQGPFSATGGQSENAAPNNQIVGAIHAVLAHPTNPDILYIGAINGGIWRTTNATAVQPDWTPLTDNLPSMSMSSLTFDTADPTWQTLYAGIGRYGSFGGTGNTRIGVLKSTDGGDTWQILNNNGALVGTNVSGIVANGNNVVFSANVSSQGGFTNIGVYRSTDGGQSFSAVSVGNGSVTGLPAGGAMDLVADPVNPNILYTAIVRADLVGGQNGIYKSTDGGASWTKVSTAVMDAEIQTGRTSNVEMAVGRQNNVYVGAINFGAPTGLFRSGDGGASWTVLDLPSTNEDGTNVGLNPKGYSGPTAADNPTPDELAGGQGSIHFSIVADPNNANIVYVGGDRQPRSFGDSGGFPNSIGARNFSGRLFRGDASQPSGSQWVHLTHSNALGASGGGTASNSSPHADSRDMTFDAAGNIIEVDDGGIFRRTNPQSNTGDWFSLTGTLQVTEAHDVAYDSLSDRIVTGNQDNGNTYQQAAGDALWRVLSGGDGGDVEVDNITLAANNQSVWYTSSQNLGGFRRTVWNADGSQASVTFPALTVSGTGLTFNDGAFRNPVEVNQLGGDRLVIQGASTTYESVNGGTTLVDLGVAPNAGIGQNAMWYGGKKNGVPNPDVLWVGSGSNVFVRTASGQPLAPVSSDPTTQTIRDLVSDPDDWASTFIVDTNSVFATSDTGNSWTDITGNLLTLAGDFFSVSYIPTSIVDAVVVGTNAGIYASLTSSLGTWFKLGTGLPNALNYDLDYSLTDDVLVVGTMGRGAWSLPSVSQVLPTRPDVYITDVTVNENSGVARFDVSLAIPAVNDVTLTLTTGDGTAVAGQDYIATTAQVMIPTGATTATAQFSVPIINGTVAELTETFTVSVLSVDFGSVGDTTAVGTGTILDDDARISVNIAAASISENGGATTATITRNTPSTAPLSVSIVSSDTSEALVTGVITIPAGQVSVTVDITALDDLVVDGNQTVTITASAIGHVSLADTVIVTDDDVPELTLIIADSFVYENDGAAATTATVSRNTDTTGPLTVTLLSSDTSEATVIGTVTIPAGESVSAPFNIDAIDDALMDGTQNITITATAGGHADGSAPLAVRDDETPGITLSVDKVTTPEQAAETVTVTATLDFASSVDVSIELVVAGTATGTGVDYTDPVTLQIDISAGSLSGTVTYSVIDDALDETDETVTFSVLSSVNAEVYSPQLVTTTIIDNDPAPTVSVTTAATVTEGATATFTISLDAVSSRDVTLTLATGGTAANGSDYTDPASLVVTIPAGTLSIDVDVPTLADGIDENDESLILGAIGYTNAVSGPASQATTTIIDGDPEPTVRLTLDTTTVAEDFGRAVLTAGLSAPSGKDVTVNVTLAGTAVNGTDYVLTGTQIVIPAGSLSASVTLTAQKDTLDEFDETVIFQIQPPINAILTGSSSLTTTILDSNIEPTVSLSASASSVLETDPSVTFFATLNQVSGKNVVVNLRLKGEAIAGTDYTATPLSVVIPAGSLTGSVVLTPIADGIDEFNELAILEFVSVTNAVENIVQQASTLIIDADPAAGHSVSRSDHHQ